jgi:hypothetical protein
VSKGKYGDASGESAIQSRAPDKPAGGLLGWRERHQVL